MTLRGVQFNNYQTADDWELIMQEKIIAPPVPKTNYVSVPGRDGDLDLTEALSGVVNYQDRQGSFIFLLTNGTHEDREELITEIVGALHGQKVQYIDTDDYPDYYMNGRLTVTEIRNSNAYGVIKIQGVFNPWRYALKSKQQSVTVTSSGGTVSLSLTNSGYKTLTPTITVTGTVTLTYGTISTTLSAGTYVLASLRFPPGVTTISIAGAGTVQFTYTEAIF